MVIMTIIGDFAILKWNSANKKRYVELGYNFTNWGDRFYVLLEHLTPTTRAAILTKCDYCGCILDDNYKNYMNNIRRSLIKKNCCDKCVHFKIKESSILKYGVDSPNKSKEVKNKKKKTLIDKYGVENVSQLNSTKEKVKQTVRKKYGVDNVFQSNEVISKTKITRYDNKSISVSRPQIYINELVNGKLNYPVGRCSIDSAILDNKIAIEYDGGGHDLHVKFKEISEKEFNQKEINREFFLINKGWKIIRIISKYDYLPDDNSLLSCIQEAINYLFTGHSWVKIDIDNKAMYGNDLHKNIEFLKTRKIFDKDILSVN